MCSQCLLCLSWDALQMHFSVFTQMVHTYALHFFPHIMHCGNSFLIPVTLCLYGTTSTHVGVKIEVSVWCPLSIFNAAQLFISIYKIYLFIYILAHACLFLKYKWCVFAWRFMVAVLQILRYNPLMMAYLSLWFLNRQAFPFMFEVSGDKLFIICHE